MPLRDHFSPPLSKLHSWEGFHGGWPMEIVRVLQPHLPPGYVAEPGVHVGRSYELDINAYGSSFSQRGDWSSDGGTATAVKSMRKPILTLDADLQEEDEFYVRVYDLEKDRELVAAVEIVSPSNKDRPASRKAFVSKCATLLQKRVCVSIVDLVTTRNFNLYTDLLDLIDRKDPKFAKKTPTTYAVTLLNRKEKSKPVLEIWPHEMKVGKPLPTLPLWLNEDDLIPLELEASYEEACRVLRIK